MDEFAKILIKLTLVTNSYNLYSYLVNSISGKYIVTREHKLSKQKIARNNVQNKKRVD